MLSNDLTTISLSLSSFPVQTIYICNILEDEISRIPYVQAYTNTAINDTAMTDADVDGAVIELAPFQVITLKLILGLV